MAFKLSLADQCLLDGFQAMQEVARQRLKVVSDKNPDNVGITFFAVVCSGVTIEVQTELGVDPRFMMSAEVRDTEDPNLEHSAVVQDDFGNQWKLLRVDGNTSSPTNRMWFSQIEPGLDS